MTDLKLAEDRERMRSIVGALVRELATVSTIVHRSGDRQVGGPVHRKLGFLLGYGPLVTRGLCEEFGVDPDFDCGV